MVTVAGKDCATHAVGGQIASEQHSEIYEPKWIFSSNIWLHLL